MAQVLGDQQTALNRFAYQTTLLDPYTMQKYREPWNIETGIKSSMNEQVYWNMRAAQVKVGEMLVPRLLGVGGRAVVDLRCGVDTSAWECRFVLEAEIKPVSCIDYAEPSYTETIRVPIPHFEFFPADWVCWACGTISDGLTHPRMCKHCGAKRIIK